MSVPRKVVVDSNFLVSCLQFKIDIARELERLLDERYELVVSSRIVDELGMLAEGRTRSAGFARLALRFIRERNVRVEKSDEHVDEWILNYARENFALACTNDIALRWRLRKARVRTIIMKGKTHLDFY
ncbi:MAG: PIN domain-containing protein [Candidatus Micrarchaeota archaeon]